MIITHDYGKFPEGINYSEGDICNLANHDLEYLEKIGVEEIWYWYASAPYEGIGQILMRKGDLYDIHNASHCSCYGPTEHAGFRGVLFEKLTDGYTIELLKEVKPLLNMANLNNVYRIW
jgi:hypothetical protein